MHINAAEANRAGLTPDQVSASVNGALLACLLGRLRLSDRSINVRVRAADDVRNDALRLGALPVAIPNTRTTAAAVGDGDVRARRDALRLHARESTAGDHHDRRRDRLARSA